MKLMKTNRSIYFLTFFLLFSALFVSCKSDKQKSDDENQNAEELVEGEEVLTQPAVSIDSVAKETEEVEEALELIAKQPEQGLNTEDLLKKKVAEVCDHLRNDRYLAAGESMWFSGRNKKRRYKSLRNQPSDEGALKLEAKQVKQWIGNSSELDFQEYTTKKDKAGEWHSLKVNFVGAKTVIFDFLKVNEEYAIGGIRSVD